MGLVKSQLEVANPNTTIEEGDETHITSRKDSDNVHECFKCNKVFRGSAWSSRKMLKRHLVTHFQQEFSSLPTVQPFSCPTCSRAFTQRKDLVTHFAVVHKVKFLFKKIYVFFRRFTST